MTEALALVARARAGDIADFEHGPPGSAGVRPGAPLPAMLLLDDLEAGPRLPPGFGSLAIFGAVTALDLSGNALQGAALPDDFFTCLAPQLRVLYTGGPAGDARCNRLTRVPLGLSACERLEDASFHDNALAQLPDMSGLSRLHTLRLDRNPLEHVPALPPSLRTLHLEGCHCGGSLDDVSELPATVREHETRGEWVDLQLPDGSHVGSFFGTSVRGLLAEGDSDGGDGVTGVDGAGGAGGGLDWSRGGGDDGAGL